MIHRLEKCVCASVCCVFIIHDFSHQNLKLVCIFVDMRFVILFALLSGKSENFMNDCMFLNLALNTASIRCAKRFLKCAWLDYLKLKLCYL